MRGILKIRQRDARRIHPLALEWFSRHRSAIESELPLKELSVKDLSVLLSGDERRELNSYIGGICIALGRCMFLQETMPSGPLPQAVISLNVDMFRAESLFLMSEVRLLLMKACDRNREQQRKLEKHRRQQAQKMSLRKLLCAERKDHHRFFQSMVKDSRHSDFGFARFMSKDDTQHCDRLILAKGKEVISQVVPAPLREMVRWDCHRSLFALLSANYDLVGVPCLHLRFDTFAVVELRIRIERDLKGSNDVSDSAQRRIVPDNADTVQNLEILGYHYSVLTPETLGYRPWQKVPLVLVKGLLKGCIMPLGTTLSATSDSSVIYKVKGFDGEVIIPDELADYLRGLGSVDEMICLGLLTEKVGGIIGCMIDQTDAEQGAKSDYVKLSRIGSRKAESFRAFDQGKRPSDPEVKALGLKPATVYRYFQSWKKAVN